MATEERPRVRRVVDAAGTTSSDRLLAIVLEEFAELGFHGSTTRSIARRAGLSSAAIYAHFPSKSAMLFELVSRTHLDILGRMQGAAAAPGTARERLERVVKAHVGFHAEMATAARVANYELHSLSREQRPHIQRMRQAMEDIVSGLLDTGIADGEFDLTEASLPMIAILSLGIDVCRWSPAVRKLSATELGERYWSFVDRMVGGPVT